MGGDSTMLGFSIYLDQEIDSQTKNYIKEMKRNGFTGVFTSVHIPEEDASKYVDRLKLLGGYCAEQKLKLTVDLDLKGLKNLGVSVSSARSLTHIGISALRLDDGFSNSKIAELSHQLNIALNASTISESDVNNLHADQADFDHMEAWHNYYPRPETGLDTDWFATKNQWLKKHHFTVMAFVPGDSKLRGPIYKGLPTLEAHRNLNPLVAADELKNKLGVDKVFIGDPQISKQLMQKFADYELHNKVQLQVKSDYTTLFKRVWHNRPEVSRDVVRLVESRKQNQITKLSIKSDDTLKRNVGAITLDNQGYGRYQGEIQICKTTLQSNPKVNVIGHVIANDLSMLVLIKENTGIEFKPDEGDK